MKKAIIINLFCLLACIFLLAAESKSQPLRIEDIKTQMINDWKRAKTFTIDYLNTMPSDKYSFKANDSTRSFAGQMLHLSQIGFHIMAYAADQPMPSYAQSDFQHRASAEVKDSVMYFVMNSYDFCINAVQNSDTAKWGEKREVPGADASTRFALMNKAFEHQTHHRGQSTIYIRLLGIKPPQEQLF